MQIQWSALPLAFALSACGTLPSAPNGPTDRRAMITSNAKQATVILGLDTLIVEGSNEMNIVSRCEIRVPNVPVTPKHP